ncbi:MAG: hydroxymethylbilane synthase [Planctomycetota bacterium]
MLRLRLATRASRLALWQARQTAALLRCSWPRLHITIVPVQSTGDRDRETPLYRMGATGVFCKEVHLAVLAGEADAGVHSCKDLPTAPPDGITLAAVLRRADPRDALIGAAGLDALPRKAVVGSSSLRRRLLLAALRPDLRFVDLRGNVGTRLAAVHEGRVDATLLAAAGLRRLDDWRSSGAVALHPSHELIPAPAQGAIAVDCRSDDSAARRLLAAIEHRPSRVAVAIERAVLAGLHGGCSLPLGCHVRRYGRLLWECHAALADEDGGLRQSHHIGRTGELAHRVLADLRKGQDAAGD